jgi:hypothetical protein
MDKYFWYKKRDILNLKAWFYDIVELEELKDICKDYLFKDCKLENAMGFIDTISKEIIIDLETHRNLSQLIDTISHEISHITFLRHSKYHTKFKNCIKVAIKDSLIEDWGVCYG